MIRWILPVLFTCFGCSFLVDPTYPEDPKTVIQDQGVQERDVSTDTIDAMRMSDRDLPDTNVSNDDISVTGDAGIVGDEGVQVDAMIPEPECSTFADCLSGQVCLSPQCDSEDCPTPPVAACEDSTTADRCELANMPGTPLDFDGECCLPAQTAPELPGACTKPISLRQSQDVSINLRDLKRRQFKRGMCADPSANAGGFYRDIVFEVSSAGFSNANTICVRNIETTHPEPMRRLANNSVYVSLFPISGCCAQDLSIELDSCRTASLGVEEYAVPFLQLDFSNETPTQDFALRIWIDNIMSLDEIPNLETRNDALALLEVAFEVLADQICCDTAADCEEFGLSCTDGICE